VKALVLHDIGKCYRFYPSPRARLLELLSGRARHTEHWALRAVNLDLASGDSLGIVGDNGAGKSTLLKLIAGTLRPTTGHMEVNGRLAAILELGAGFHPEFTGRDNVFFAGMLMGIGRPELERCLPEIIEFAELEEAIDHPVKTYSSGMFVRLAFSLVTSVHPEILIVDEALAVGDQHFQKKCIDRMSRFRDRGCTVLFCSHSLYHIRQLCTRAVWLHQGDVRAVGDTDSVLAAYENHVRRANAQLREEPSLPLQPTTVPLAGRGRLIAVELEGVTEATPPLLVGRDLVVSVIAEVAADEPRPHLGILIERSDGIWIYATGTHLEGQLPHRLDEGRWGIRLRFPDLPLFSGEYWISAYLFDSSGLVVYEEWLKCRSFHLIRDGNKIGLVHLAHEWQ